MRSPAEVIKETLPLGGLAGWGALRADGEFAGECLAGWIWPEQVRQMALKLRLASSRLQAQGLDARTACWVYDRARIYAVVKPDNSCIVLVAENRPGLAYFAYDRLLQQLKAA